MAPTVLYVIFTGIAKTPASLSRLCSPHLGLVSSPLAETETKRVQRGKEREGEGGGGGGRKRGRENCLVSLIHLWETDAIFIRKLPKHQKRKPTRDSLCVALTDVTFLFRGPFFHSVVSGRMSLALRMSQTHQISESDW